MVLSDLEGLHTERIIKMAILHDLAESIIGDITPGKITDDEKITKEQFEARIKGLQSGEIKPDPEKELKRIAWVSSRSRKQRKFKDYIARITGRPRNQKK